MLADAVAPTMRHTLKIHPDSQSRAARRVDVDIVRSGINRWILSYSVTGTIAQIRLPPVMEAARSDDLWQHTCFEAFIRASTGPDYYEFNFAPSTQWAAYRFSGYRSGRTSPAEIGIVPIEVQADADRFILSTSLALAGMPELADRFPLHLGLSAIIEDQSGGKSYWALAHPPGQPDFHHPDCFAIALSSDGPA